jgi:exodeoxyribonuclease III
MKCVSWNVAGFRAVLKKGFKDFFNEVDADIFCIQEVKALKNQIEFDAPNYYEYLNVADRPGYSGTMVYCKKEPISVTYGMNEYINDNEGRIITLEYDKFYFKALNKKYDDFIKYCEVFNNFLNDKEYKSLVKKLVGKRRDNTYIRLALKKINFPES